MLLPVMFPIKLGMLKVLFATRNTDISAHELLKLNDCVSKED